MAALHLQYRRKFETGEKNLYVFACQKIQRKRHFQFTLEKDIFRKNCISFSIEI